MSESSMISFTLNNQTVTVPAEGTLLTALREGLRNGSDPVIPANVIPARVIPAKVISAKDGCAPQGQCGCCTVWVDGEPRVACVTPVARVSGRSVTTLEGLDEKVREIWSEALCATGGSQCGFCTPGIIMRLAAKVPGDAQHDDLRGTVDTALLAHMCRCTGWQTIHEAAVIVASDRGDRDSRDRPDGQDRRDGRGDLHDVEHRDPDRASRRATIEGRAPQIVNPHVALGEGGFADDRAPDDALVAVLSPEGTWIVGETPAAARKTAGVVPGRKSTLPVTWPVEIPRTRDDGVDDHGFVNTLRTTWVEPGYLEPDAVWCMPGGEPVGPLVNGGSFGGKALGGTHGHGDDEALNLGAVARRLADEHGRPMRVIMSREDVVRLGPKRPPMAIGVRADGSGEVWAVSTPGLRDLIERCAPDWVLHEIDNPASIRTSLAVRAAGWAEIAVMRSAVRGSQDRNLTDPEYTDHVISPEGAEAWATVTDELVRVRVRCGSVLDHVVLRSYCIGAAHMALGWVRSEGIAVDEAGRPVDLTIRSFGILRAVDMPEVHVEIVDDENHDAVNGGDAVFAAVAAAAWRHAGFPPTWPCSRGS